MPNQAETRTERDNTDESLRIEREKADQALDEKLTALQVTADEVIEVARARADRVLAKERAKIDRKLDASAPGLPASHNLDEERSHEDRALQKERATADRALDEERAIQGALLANERKETDEDLSNERMLIDQALAIRDEFLGLVSHDLRNLLSSMMGYASVIITRVDQPEHEASILKSAKAIQRAGTHMNRLVGDLLDVASIHAGMLAVTKEQGDPMAVLAEAVESFQEQAALRKIELYTESEKPLPPVEFDAARILQVLTNLLSNSLKFTPAGGRVVLGIEHIGDDVCFFVTDTGVGIPAHMLQSIFERFLQVDQNDRRGLGLGLYISRCIVQGHGGRIWVESEVGQGSSFRFTLPLQAAA